MTDMDLYQELSESVGVKNSQRVQQMFKILLDESEARILMAAAPPATVEELAEKSGLSSSQVEKMIEPLFKKGVLFKSKKPDATRYYRVKEFLQFHDAVAVAQNVPQELLDLLKDFMNVEYIDYLTAVKEIIPGPIFRVVPINVSIEPDTQIMIFDDVKELIKSADKVAVTSCACRVIDGACGKPTDVCLQLNKAADYCVERGTGKMIDTDQAMEILRKSEEAGLIHISRNAKSAGKVICNCCEDCCMSWAVDKLTVKKGVSPSRFTAEVDPELCTSCETCIERCFFDAILLEGKDDTSLINPKTCMGCGLCLITCPEEAISLKEVRPVESIPD